MAGQRVSLAGLATEAVETVPGHSRPTLVHLTTDQIVPTPLNPRQDFSEESLRELGESMRQGQLQPCVGVTRAAYVRLFPEHADQLPQCRVVMAAGERRWRAALEVGLATVDVHIREDIAESRVRFLAAVLTENVERSNFNYIEEAVGLQRMLDLTFNQQVEAAAALGKSKQWFSQRIGLLRLTEPMRELVVSGKLTALRDMRRYSALPSDEQLAAWQADQRDKQESNPRPAPKTPTAEEPLDAAPTVNEPHEGTDGDTSDLPTPASGPPTASSADRNRRSQQEPDQISGAADAQPSGYTAVYPQRGTAQDGEHSMQSSEPLSTDGDGGSTLSAPASSPLVRMPWGDPAAVAQLVFAKMAPPDRTRLRELLAAEEVLNSR
ncbi:ParB/RepB/Spo0J family partition protein [Streptomyces sp. NPDC057910]|uniref:ParB/RepB/Spo0J family partition protein n=1 Tax=Streptomyces sp. NPDC057910 TaxID=3346278 RepID=UPI0036E99F88